MESLFRLLESLGIRWVRVDHPPVFTVEEALRDVPPMEGVHAKSLLLRDRSGKRHILVVVGFGTAVDLALLSEAIPSSKLSLASPERLMRCLGVLPGAVSILALHHDTGHDVEVIVDKEVWEAEALQCHPMVNTATVTITKPDLVRFLESTGHAVRVMEVPKRQDRTRDSED